MRNADVLCPAPLVLSRQESHFFMLLQHLRRIALRAARASCTTEKWPDTWPGLDKFHYSSSTPKIAFAASVLLSSAGSPKPSQDKGLRQPRRQNLSFMHNAFLSWAAGCCQIWTTDLASCRA